MGGLIWSGSSITLRMLENDFIQNRSQLLDLVSWLKQKLRIWMSLPDCKQIRFADFRMADDIQKNQQLIGLNSQGKVSDQTLLTELGYDYDQEVKKRIEEIYVANYLMDLQSKGGAKSQGEAQLIQFNYQQKINELTQRAQADAEAKLGLPPGGMSNPDTPPGEAPDQGNDGAQPSGGAATNNAAEFGQSRRAGASAVDQSPEDQIESKVQSWAKQLTNLDPNQARLTIAEIKTKMPDIGQRLEQAFSSLQGGQAASPAVNMTALPERAAPRRLGAV
jgi:hypothetical protein